jgi:hypothetical protein
MPPDRCFGAMMRPAATRTKASSRRLHGFLFGSGSCCPAAAGRRLSRLRFCRKGGWRRRSESRQSGRSGGTTPAKCGAESPKAGVAGSGRHSKCGPANRAATRPNILPALDLPGQPAGSPGQSADQLLQPAFPSVFQSACASSRDDWSCPKLERMENKCRVCFDPHPLASPIAAACRASLSADQDASRTDSGNLLGCLGIMYGIRLTLLVCRMSVIIPLR